MAKLYSTLLSLSHDRNMAAALGDIIVAWANAENALTSVYMSVLGIDSRRATTLFYSMPNFSGRVKTLRRLLLEFEPDETRKEKLLKHIDKLNTLSKRRNDLIHSVWASNLFDERNTVLIDHRALPGATDRMKPVKVHELEKHSHLVLERALKIAVVNNPELDPSNEIQT